ncbi:MAG: MBL fold metallo-hydrolase [Candidatus Dadabacteria bacterium]|nr:MAG: MBL fold metallo-hydrolase [Candidatus Dadabacteria bacterium]
MTKGPERAATGAAGRIVAVGTGTCVPRLDRRGPCTLLEAAGYRVAVDLGLGALHGLLAAGVGHQALDAVVFTHLHPDHTAELVALLFAAGYDETPRTRPLTLVGGPGFGRFVEALRGAYGDWLDPRGYRLELRECAPGDRLALGPWALRAGPARHHPSSLALRWEHAGRSFVITGDTGPDRGLARFARGADLLVAEASLPEGAAFDRHLTARQAGDLAREARAGALVLHHLYPSADRADPGRHAAEAFPGPVIVARDGQVVWEGDGIAGVP